MAHGVVKLDGTAVADEASAGIADEGCGLPLE
jgi:hypothetical protein